MPFSTDTEGDANSPFPLKDSIKLRQENKFNNQNSILQRLVIKKESYWKNLFDLVILFLAAYTITVNAYYAAFGTPTEFKHILFDYFIEVCFLLDIFFTFCHEYID